VILHSTIIPLHRKEAGEVDSRTAASFPDLQMSIVLANVVGPDETSFCVSWSERQIDEIPDRYDPGIAELPQTEQVLVFANDEV
jgi:hypothetical protein